MIYLIGGPARSGKSTLGRRLRKELDAQVMSGDALTESLLSNLKQSWLPDIFVHAVNPIRELKDSHAQVERVRARDQATWPFLARYIQEVAEQERDNLLLEGDIWPDSVVSLAIPHKAAFLVDTSSVISQARRLKAIRDGAGSNNWMQHWSDKNLDDWAQFNLLRSQRYVQLCEETNGNYFDIADGGMQAAQDRAFDYLLKNAV